MAIKEVLPDDLTSRLPFPASTANDVGDLLFWDNTNKYAKKASARTDTGSAAGNQADFAPLFAGIAADQRLATETAVTVVASAPRGPSDRTVKKEAVCDCDCASATFEVGDLVGVARDASNSVNFNQKVAGVATENLAIGMVIQREPTAVTKVRCWLSAKRYGWYKSVAGGGSGENEINTAITTVGAGTLTAAGLVGGVITRSGPVAAYTDTTATAAAIIAASPIQDVGTSWELTIKNTVPYLSTLAAASGVTLSGQSTIPPNSVLRALVTINSATTVTIVGLFASPMTAPPLQANTAITTAGAGTLTAAAMVGGVITRSGPVAAYSDTVDTAANIIAALPNANVGQSFELQIKNTVAFAETIVTAAGVTLSGQVIVPPNSVGTFLVTYNGAGTVTIQGISVTPMTTGPLEVSTNLTTVGAGTITAAGIAGGVTNRTGSTAAFTDTTDTGANLQAALPNANVGQSFEWTYYNNTAGPATITGTGGVTVSVITIVPQGMWARYLVTLTAANTFTIVGVMMGPCLALPNSQYTTAALSTTTASAGQLTGAANVFMNNSGANPGTYTTRTGAQMAADLPGIPIGFSYTLFLCNGQGTGTLTLAAGASGVTITGTATAAANVGRIYQVTYTAANTFVFTNVGSFTAP